MSNKPVPFEDLIPLRELMLHGKAYPNEPYPDIKWDFLTLYDQGGNVVARSIGYSKTATIPLRYNGLLFIATPGYDGNETISVEWNSLLQTANQ